MSNFNLRNLHNKRHGTCRGKSKMKNAKYNVLCRPLRFEQLEQRASFDFHSTSANHSVSCSATN